MKTQHNIQIPEYMSENNTKTLLQSQRKKTLTCRLLSLLTMVTMLAWGNSAWADSTIKKVNGTTTIWDFTKVTEAMCADLSSGNWTKCQDTESNDVGFKSNANAGDETPAFMGGLTINTCGADKSRVYYNAQGYCFNGGSAYIIIPVTAGKELAVYSAQQINSNDVNLTASGGAYVATIPEGKTSVKILRNSGATYVTKIVLRDPLPTLDTSAEATTQDTETPEGWNKVQLPKIDIYSDVTLPTKGDGALSSTANNRSVIQAAIDAANTAGGGIVRIPVGTWLSGPIVMKSNVVLHLNEGATLMALPFGGVDYDTQDLDGEKYPYSGNVNDKGLKNYNTFITCASGAQNVVIEGDGVTSIIDGQGADWWPSYDLIGTRPPLIRFDNGSKFLVRYLKLQNAAGVNLTLGNGGQANNFTVHHVTISNPSSEDDQLQQGEVKSHNTDGIPVWGPFANIYDCNISTGDDNIVADSHAHHLHAWNITCGYGHGMSMGSYTEDLHDVIYEYITFTGTSCGFRLKTNNDRSGNDTKGSNGAVKNIICRNATMTGVPSPIKITSWYDSDKEDPADVSTPSAVEDKTPEFCNILFKTITADAVAGKTQWKHNSPIYIYGRPEMPIHDVTFDNVQIASKRGAFFAYCDDIKFINGSNVTNETTPSAPIATYYDVTNVTGGFKASNLALVEGKESQSLSQGDTYTLTKNTDYTTTLGNGAITFESSNTRVATVDEDGKITAVGAGTATITIKQASTIEYADKSVEVAVTVSLPSPKEWNFSDWDAVAAGSMENPLVNNGLSIYPIYDSNDTQKSAIDANNKSIDGYSFTKRFKFGGQSTSAKSGTGYMKFDVAGPTDIVVYGMCGSSDKTSDIYLSTVCRTTTENEYLVKWTDVSGSSISKNEYSYTGGPTTIYLYCSTNSANIYCIKATPKNSLADCDLATITPTKTMGVGEEYTLAATTDYTTSSTGAVTYESSNTKVATVSDAGVITAVAAGTATITINQAADENYAAGSCEIAVTVEGASSDKAGTITWAVGNESAGTVSSEIADAVSRTKVAVGSDLTATQVGAYSSIAGSVPMVKYVPTTSNPGTVAADMIEYTVTMKKGVTFKPTSVVFDAVKEGTDGAYFSWSYTIDGVESDITVYSDPKTQIRRNNNANPSAPLTHNEEITAEAGRTFTLRFYISNVANDKAMSIGNIKINGIVNGTPEKRTFQDFKIDFRSNTYTVIKPDNQILPTGVVVDVKAYHDAQHGVKNHSTITVPVDGPVKFTIGGCNFSNSGASVTVDGGTPIAIETKSAGCDGGVGSYNKFATYTYNVEEAATLVFDLGDYCPYFFAEACEFIPTVDVTYYNTDGTTVIGKETVEGSSALAYAYGESDVTIPEGSKFRGWFNTKFNTIESYTGKKVAAGTILNEDTKLYAVATPVEVATPGKTFTYDLTKDYFYQEDHEGITMTGKPYNSHGWIFGKDQTIVVPVAGNAIIKMGLCQFSGDANKVNVTSENNVGTLSPTEFDCKVATDGNIQEIRYEGPATTLTFTLPSGGYIHEVEVANDEIPESDLAVVEGKSVIVLNPGGTYQLTKGEDNDYTTSSEGALTYVSDNKEMVTVSETGLLTAGTGFGQATITVSQAGNDKFQAGSIDFIVKVVSAHGQTAKPSATVGEDGKVYLSGNTQDPDSKIYYTTNGDEPTSASTEYNGEGVVVPAGTIVKAIAINDDKSPSDIVTAYYKIPVTLKWSGAKFDLTYEDESLKPLFDANTTLQLGSKLNNNGSAFSTNDSPAISFAQIASKEVNNNRDKDLSLRFNVLMKAGMGFKPSAISFISSRGGTNGGKLDVTYEDADNESVLFTDVTPNRCNKTDSPYDGSGKYHTQYNYSDGDLSSLGFSEDASLYIYQKGLGTSYYGYTDITITGYVSGSLYDGEFYNVGYDIEPAESGYVVQKPSISSVMAGKTVVFNATPAEGYKFINWTKTVDGATLSTDKTFIRTITEDTYITANFQKIPLVTFSKENMTDIDGNVPAAQYVDGETYELNIPVNYVLYREGYTMIGWTDGEKIYELGKSHHFDEDITLKPKFQRNEVSITDINEKVTVRWDFNHRERPENAPELNVYTNEEQTEKSTGIYTRTAMVNGMPVDMKMSISAPEAQTKLDNCDMTIPVTTAQVNPRTKVTIPAVPGMKVILKASESKDERTITGRTSPRHTKFIADTTIPSYFGDDINANPTRVDDYTAEYIYNGNDKTVTLTFLQIAGQGDWGFYEWIEVEYPVLQEVKLFNSITAPLDREKNENAGTIEITAKTPEHANTGKRYLVGDVVTVSAEAKYGYTITGFTCNGEDTKLTEQTIADGAKTATVKYTVAEGENIVTAVYARQTTYAVRVTTADLSLGEVTLDPIYENFLVRGKDYIEGHYVQGTEVKLKSEAGEGNVLSYWMDGAETWKDDEGNPNQHNPNVDITVGTDATFYTAYFRPGEKGTVIFDMTGSGVHSVSDPNTYSGSVSMNPATLSGVRSFNVPTNFTFFKPDYTLLHWKVKDSDATYELGQRGSFTSPDQTITLVPVFRENKATQINRTNNPIIRYDFGSGIFNYDDPTSGTTRKVSAQKVSIPSNTKTFWTSKVWTEVLVDGNPDKNWRDVAMWVNTSTKGFIRNGDLPEWAAFGPGTILEVASCSGTKFSIMTYAPITSTTIDGVVPVLDEERSNPANHEYVYTHTTRSAEDRVKIVIGNDYSYYKWLESATLAANMVDLHIKTSDNVVGEVTSVKSWDEENYPSKDLDDGGKSFQKGNKVVVTFYRKFGADFKQIIDPAKNDLPILEMLDNGKVRMVRLGDGTELETLDRNQDGTWGGGNEHVFKLSMADADNTEKAKGFRTKYVVEFEITNHRDLEIQFKEKPTYYVTYNTGKEAVGVSPSAAWVEAGDYYTIGKNQTLYYEGHTLHHWVDLAGNVYNIGTAYQMSPTEPRDMLLYPVFRQNTFSLLDLSADATATWQLGRGNGAPVISYQRINGIYIAQVSNGESEIDVKLDLIGVNGKIDNKSFEERAQINEKSAFFFPVTDGCVVGLNSSSPNNLIETTKIFRKDSSNGGYVKGQFITAEYSGVAGEDSVVFANDGKYYTQFCITYKAQPETAQPTLTSVKYGDTAFTADQLKALTTNGSITLAVEPDVVTNRVPAITAVVENGKADIEQATYQNPVATVTLKTDGGMSIKAYAVNFQFNKPATAPTLSSVKVRNATVTAGVANNAPVSGSIEITFDRIMKAASVTPVSPGETIAEISAPQGKTLTFNYWHLPVDKDVTITIPAETLQDVYGMEYPEAINLTLHTAATNMAVEHKTFDYVVGFGQVPDINNIIQKVNANRGTERVRIFIPDGEYELTGNEISSWKAGDETTDENGVSMKIPAGGLKYQNHMTVISRANVSLIGQSQENTILYNHPKYEGIGCTATIHVTGADDYIEDMTLENRFPYYKANFAGRAVAFWDQGNRQVLKNVSLLSYQDTYYSHGNGNYRGYFEDCLLAGTVDWLCGNGDIWLERCGIMVRNRNGNNIAAPATSTSWGYVFNNCRIYPEEGADLVTDKSYTLARPWQGTPGATYLNTTFDVLPRDEGWQAMTESHVLKFHEYNSMDSYGHPISLGSRTLAGAAPLKGSDDLILTDEAASKYTIETVLGGGEAFDPRIYTQQIDAKSGGDKDANNSFKWDDGIELDDDRLQWNTEPMALCYFIFKKDEAANKWNYVTNVAQSSEDETVTGLSLEPYGRGLYCVRAANQRGGLGAPTMEVQYEESKKYVLTLSQVGSSTDGFSVTENGKGWSTICLPYNSKVPTVNVNGDTLKVYRGTYINDFDLILERVTVINKNQGYVVCGPIGQYEFTSSSHTDTKDSSLSGNPNSEPIERGNNNGYVLSYKTTYGVGFYKYNGATIPANRAWLPVTALTNPSVGSTPNPSAPQSTRPISLRFANNDEATGITDMKTDNTITTVYDLQGRRINASQMVKGHIYIINGKKEKL